jgi:hypothetical protein
MNRDISSTALEYLLLKVCLHSQTISRHEQASQQ